MNNWDFVFLTVLKNFSYEETNNKLRRKHMIYLYENNIIK